MGSGFGHGEQNALPRQGTVATVCMRTDCWLGDGQEPRRHSRSAWAPGWCPSHRGLRLRPLMVVCAVRTERQAGSTSDVRAALPSSRGIARTQPAGKPFAAVEGVAGLGNAESWAQPCRMETHHRGRIATVGTHADRRRGDGKVPYRHNRHPERTGRAVLSVTEARGSDRKPSGHHGRRGWEEKADHC